MVNDQEVYRSARGLMDIYGADAEERARSKVELLARLGDIEGTAAWWRILAAVQELQAP